MHTQGNAYQMECQMNFRKRIVFVAVAFFLHGVVFAAGPGTEMTRIINRAGLGSDCGRCKALANEMDCRGSDWVLQNRQHVVQRTISNAENLGHRMGPARRLGVRAIVRTAVRRASY